MHFVVGLQVNEHVFFNPWKSQGVFFSSNSVKRPVNVDHMIFSLILTSFFESAPKQIIVPLNL